MPKAYKKMDRTTLLCLLLGITIIAALTDLAFAVTTRHDVFIFVCMAILLFYNIAYDIREDRRLFSTRLKQIFKCRAGWLFIAVCCYYVYDLITILYTRDIGHSLGKLPYMLEYTLIFVCSAYCIAKKSTYTCRLLLFCIGISGTIVSICSYFYYAFSLKPTYFQRLSTARDYNVYSCLIVFTTIVLIHFIVNLLNTSYAKRLILFVAIIAVNMPAFYLSGSRRMFILLPYFFGFVAAFELSLLIYKWLKSAESKTKRMNLYNFLRAVTFFVAIVVLYFGCVQLLPVFTEIGTKKEACYNKTLQENIDSGKRPIGNNSTNSVSGEKTISNVLETIDDKSMFNKRSIIYRTAFEALEDYTAVDWIFGRGGAYDIHMYNVTDNKELLEAYGIDENNSRARGWMSAHNFMLADLLNGGIIKLLLGVFVVIQLAVHIVKAIRLDNRNALLLVVPTALVLINNFISGAYGMLNDVFFYSVMIMLFSVLSINSSALYRKEVKKCLTD